MFDNISKFFKNKIIELINLWSRTENRTSKGYIEICTDIEYQDNEESYFKAKYLKMKKYLQLIKTRNEQTV